MASPLPGPDTPAPLLVIAHPGHEIRIHGWLAAMRPVVCVLTDGSGHTAASRLASSALVIAAAGARQGPVFGRLSDRALYEALRLRDAAPFAALARELAALIVRDRVSLVVADAAEGFNPGHDVCRFVADAAVAIAARHGQTAATLEFVLDAAPGNFSADGADDAVRFALDDGGLDRKLAAAWNYAELRGEVETALARFGREAFRDEWLRPPTTARMVATFATDAPFFERHGRARVAEGVYDAPLTWREHLHPVYESLRALHEQGAPTACGADDAPSVGEQQSHAQGAARDCAGGARSPDGQTPCASS